MAEILRGELDRSLGIGEDETLVDYMQKCDPTIIDALKSIESNTKKGVLPMAVPPMLIERKRRINELKMPDYPPLLVEWTMLKTNYLSL